MLLFFKKYHISKKNLNFLCKLIFNKVNLIFHILKLQQILFLLKLRTSLCYHTVSILGGSTIIAEIFRNNDCLEIDTGIAPYYFAFTSSKDIHISMYTHNSTTNTYTLDVAGNISSLNKAGIITKDYTVLLFQFSNPTYFSIGLSSLELFNCSRVFIDNSQNSDYVFSTNNKDFFSLPIYDTRCFFYSASGQQSYTILYEKCHNGPTIEVYAGLKQKIDTIYPGETKSQTNPMIDTPTFIIIRPNEPNSNLEYLHMNISSSEVPFGNITKIEFQGIQNYNSSLQIHYKYVGNTIALVSIGLSMALIVLMTVYIVCKHTYWCRRKLKVISFDETQQLSGLPIFTQSVPSVYYS